MTNQDFPNTVGEAAQRWHDNHVRDCARNNLHSAMGYPRWDLLPVEPMEKESSLRIATRHLTNFIRRFWK